MIGSGATMSGLPGKPAYQPDIQTWRDRAKEARTEMEQMSDPVCRSMILPIAQPYERLIEWQLATDRLRAGDPRLQ
jgi:hypothetical protein